jgi:tRNA 2-thiouridine synthesizing protein C
MMSSVIQILDVAPHGTEKAFGILHAAIVCLPHGSTIGLYGDGTYLALSGQKSTDPATPNLSHFIYAYPEIRVLAHKPSLEKRGLGDRKFIELVEVMDEDEFMNEVKKFDHVMLL